ncbi:uncharacterized protein M6B38_192765 [Iris pallida]|uniref:Uncharacterized protein n=1 Tax=Iris pallida TaxID=29817 RepID=A0AAX6EDB4_IRIPA|nr:uncharacterized protein M6B38_192765 [Iris pallida]
MLLFPPLSSSSSRFLLLPISFFFFLLLHPLSADTQLSVSSAHPSSLRLPPGERVERSPGSRPGSPVVCNRVHIRGLSRWRNLTSFADSLRIRVSVAQGDAIFRIQTIEICLHRNATLGVGMCRSTEWHKLSKGSWVRSVSPFGDWILDIRMLPDPSRSIDVSFEQEFMYHRVVLLVLGLVMMAAARDLSESVVFYYGSAMTIGIVLVILMILFQGMRLLPTGRKSSLAIVLYSSIVGLAAFLFRHLSALFRLALLEIGISEDMLNPLGVLLLVCLVLAGAWFGYWGVRKLALTDDGLVDTGVAYFVEWAVLIFAAAMIIQSSLDIILAAGALGFAIVMTTISRMDGKLRIVRRFFKRTFKWIHRIHIETLERISESWVGLSRPRPKFHGPTSCDSPVRGRVAGSTRPGSSYEEDKYLSTYHKTPERKRLSKEEWEKITQEHTKKALRELVSSPEFSKWAVANADRISVTPPGVANRESENRRWF